MQDPSLAGNPGFTRAHAGDPFASPGSSERRGEQEIRASEAHYRRLFETMQDGILILDAETGEVADANPAMEDLLGYSREELVGRTLGEIGLFNDEAALKAPFAELQRGDRPRYQELLLETKDGKRVEVEFISKAYFEGPRQFIQCSIRDLSERKAVEMASLRLAAIVDSSEDAIIGKDLQGIVTSWNRGAERIFGYTAKEMVGSSIMCLIPADRQDEENLILGRIKRGESLEHFETIRQTKNGYMIHVSVTVSPIKDANGKVLGVSKVARDITSMKRVEAELHESQQTLRMTLAAAQLGHWAVDLRTHAAERSLRHDQIFGYDELVLEWTHEKFLSHVHPDDREEVDRLFQAGMTEKSDWDFECRIIRWDGALRWIWAHGNIFTDAAGEAVQMAGVVSDITDRKMAEEVIAREQERFKLIFETVPVGIALATTQPDGRITRVINEAHLRICGLTAEEDQIPGIYRRLRHPDEFELQDELYRQVDAGEINEFTLEKRFVRLDGTVVWVVFSLQRWKFADGRTEQLTTVVDITARKNAEEKIQQFNAELEQRVIERTAQFETANTELEAFSYSVSHDLRAPLRAVDGFSQAVVDDYSDVVPEECRRYLQIIRESAQKMGMLIDDLLTFSRLSRLPLGKQRVNVANLVRSVLAELESQQTGRRIEVEIGGLPDCDGDPSLLRQVWVNLLSNAMKYTRKREVARVEIGCEATQDGNAYFVRDNGTGFDMRYVGKLFGVFQRLHRAEDYEGTGVGLAIVQRVIHRHGGRVWAEAAVDRGATFHFTLESKTE